jgi:hypothetical protein
LLAAIISSRSARGSARTGATLGSTTTANIPSHQHYTVYFEARRDKNGHLVVYDLPKNDGGGDYEVAGINLKYDHDDLRKADVPNTWSFPQANGCRC